MGQDPKGPQDPPKDGNPSGNPAGNPDPNVVALQQKLTERDKELKAALARVEELDKSRNAGSDETRKELEAMRKTIEKLTGTISSMETDKERERLKDAYPDIVPELLIGKSKDEIEKLVKAQRDTIAKNYQRLPSAHEPVFADRSEVEKAIESVKGDKSLSTDQKLQKIRELKEARDEF